MGPTMGIAKKENGGAEGCAAVRNLDTTVSQSGLRSSAAIFPLRCGFSS